MTPIDLYLKKCKEGLITEDHQQLAVLQHLQTLYQHLLHEQRKRSGLHRYLRKPRRVQGIYLWGGVGVGKTFLMDCFFNCIPFNQKLRMHFHQFMRMVHEELKKHQGEKDPLVVIAKKIAKKTMLLCFDELHVTDIADAMLLARLFKALLANGVCLVATSNSMPDDLYKNGLQRRLFLPAIEMLKENMHVLHIITQYDYRMRHFKQAGVFYMPNNADAQANMEKSFALLANEQTVYHHPLLINDRFIKVKKQTEDSVWFEFNDICSVPRSQLDYLSIAAQFRTVFISNIPIIPPNAKNTIALFIRLIDVLYDARVRLIISAAVPVAELYPSGYMLAEYSRTRSRLVEMQSEAYFVNAK